MLPLLLPLIGAAIGGGLGALKDKKNRGRGALIGAGLGGVTGGLGAIGGAAAGGALGARSAGVAAGLSGNVGPFANAAKYASALGTAKKFGGLKSLLPLAPMALGAMGGHQQDPQQLPPMFVPNSPIPDASMSLGQQYGRPFAPPVQSSYGGYYG